MLEQFSTSESRSEAAVNNYMMANSAETKGGVKCFTSKSEDLSKMEHSQRQIVLQSIVQSATLKKRDVLQSIVLFQTLKCITSFISDFVRWKKGLRGRSCLAR